MELVVIGNWHLWSIWYKVYHLRIKIHTFLSWDPTRIFLLLLKTYISLKMIVKENGPYYLFEDIPLWDDLQVSILPLKRSSPFPQCHSLRCIWPLFCIVQGHPFQNTESKSIVLVFISSQINIERLTKFLQLCNSTL